MRVAEVAPLYESVPPRWYGGTERVVSWLTDELVRQGHDVTLFASGVSPTLYPVSCAQQAWAAAAVFLLLQACLGLEVSGEERKLVFSDPLLPEFLEWVHIRGLRIGTAEIDVMLERHPHDIGVNVLRRSGDLRVIVSK